jgi:uncharacterized lipoprotein YajG
MKHTMALSIILLAAGCSGDEQTAAREPPPAATDAAPKKTIIDDQLRAMDKARGVGDTLQQTVDKNLDAADRQLE